MKVSSKISKHHFTMFVFSLLFVLAAGSADIRMFSNDLNDGFFAQVIYVSENITNFSFSVLSPLFIIHTLRLVIVAPFYFIFIFNLPAYFDAIVFLCYVFPVASLRHARFNHVVTFLALLLPFVFSYRTTLGMIGMLYLYICLFYVKGKYLLLLLSALLANLSSGMVLGWLFSVVASFKYVRVYYSLVVPAFVLMLSGFVGSLIHKYDFMFSERGASENGSLWERNTFYVSLIDDNYFRFYFYLALTLMLLCILFLSMFSRGFSNRRFLFFLSAFPLVFFEGIGLVSYLLCIALVLLNNSVYYFSHKNSSGFINKN